jgi:DNA-binding NarL/FixJ family response regulator
MITDQELKILARHKLNEAANKVLGADLHVKPIPAEGLSFSQIEILERLANGESKEFIQKKTGLAQSTIRNRLSAACKFLNVNSDFELIAKAISIGLIKYKGKK